MPQYYAVKAHIAAMKSTYAAVSRVPRPDTGFEPDSSFSSRLVVSQPRSPTLDVPAGAAGVGFRRTGSNIWYRVVDGVKITAV
ncbi:hypothetical protein [Streptomyces enissocaesilis]|uniref:Uncharacterized protein n=1 Tax=Streptomyces enissocaesilis TaxID=332589 RepID=A0ABN3XIP7_9ACTN